MSWLLPIVAVVLLMTVLMVVPALAQTVAPGGGSAFGEHVSSMAPEHPRDHGRDFGKCVSTMATMAQTGLCPHE
jgi:hypothetical protein